MAQTFILMLRAPTTAIFFLLDPKFLEDPGLPVYLSYSDHVDALLAVAGHRQHLTKYGFLKGWRKAEATARRTVFNP